MMKVVGTASTKASQRAMFCSYFNFFLIPISGFWYNDLMTLRAAETLVSSIEDKVIYIVYRFHLQY